MMAVYIDEGITVLSLSFTPAHIFPFTWLYVCLHPLSRAIIPIWGYHARCSPSQALSAVLFTHANTRVVSIRSMRGGPSVRAMMTGSDVGSSTPVLTHGVISDTRPGKGGISTATAMLTYWLPLMTTVGLVLIAAVVGAPSIPITTIDRQTSGRDPR